MKKIDFTIIVLAYHGTRTLPELFQSLELAMRGAREKTFELIMVINGQAPLLAPILEEYAQNSLWKFVHLDKPLPPPLARNHALARAHGEWVVYFDDDISVPEHYFAKLSEFQESEATVIGGPNLNPPDSSSFEDATGRILGSRLITGPFASRYAARGKSQLTRKDWRFILCNLAVRRNSAKMFPDDMPFGEENAMLLDLGFDGRKFLFVPELYVFHRRRPTQLEFLRQMMKYGKGRGLLIQKYGFRASSNLWLALAFTITAILLVMHPILFAALYATTVSVIATSTALRKNPHKFWSAFPQAVSAILICHIFYPAGCLLGWLSRSAR